MAGVDFVLPLRPIPIDGESWPGYLLRIASANALNGLRRLGAMLKLSSRQLIACEPDVILARLGHSRSVIESLDLTESRNVSERSGLLERAGRALNGRVCPACLREDQVRHIRAVWDDYLVLSCFKHNCILLDHCPQCKRPIDYTRPAVDRCACGLLFARHRTASAPAWMKDQFYRVMRVDAAPTSASTFCANSVDRQRAAIAIQRLINVARRARHQVPPGARIHARARMLRTTDFDAIAAIFDDWPNGFHQACAWYVGCRTAVDSLIARKRLYAKHFPELDLQLSAFHLDHRRLLKRAPGVAFTARQHRPGISMRQCAALSGLPYSSLLRLAARGYLQGVAPHSKMMRPTTAHSSTHRIH